MSSGVVNKIFMVQIDFGLEETFEQLHGESTYWMEH